MSPASLPPGDALGEFLPVGCSRLFSLHAGQLRRPGQPWQATPPRLFLRPEPVPRIGALCASGRLYHTHAYDQACFRLEGQDLDGLAALAAYFQQQLAALHAGLAEAGAVVLAPAGGVRALTPAAGPAYAPAQMAEAVGEAQLQRVALGRGPYAGYSLVTARSARQRRLPINTLGTSCWLAGYPLSDYLPDVLIGPALLLPTASLPC